MGIKRVRNACLNDSQVIGGCALSPDVGCLLLSACHHCNATSRRKVTTIGTHCGSLTPDALKNMSTSNNQMSVLREFDPSKIEGLFGLIEGCGGGRTID